LSDLVRLNNTAPTSSWNLLDHVDEFARHRPFSEALVDKEHSISFGDLPSLIDRYAQCLNKLGIVPNCTVRLSVAEQIPHILICLALLKLQSHQVTFGPQESGQYVESVCDRLNVSHVVRLVGDFDPVAPSLHDFDVTIQKRVVAPPILKSGSKPLIFLMTSGTTRGPRIIPVSEDTLIGQANRYEGLPFDRVMVLPSIQHNIAKRFRLLSLLRGATSIFYSGNTSAWPDIFEFVENKNANLLRITILNAIALAKQSGRPLGPTRSISIGSAHIPNALRRMIRKNLCERLYVTYGSTESGTVAMVMPDEHDDCECVGKPFNSVALEVVDNHGVRLAAGQIGEIRMRGEGMVSVYYDDPTESAKRFRGRWYYPGDLGSVSDGGELTIHGRKDDMMSLNGINIYPAEIERAFESHPEVAAAAAFAIYSKSHGAIPAVAIELANGSKTSEQALMQYSKDRLGIRRPRKVIIVDRIPRNDLGKILTRHLVESFKIK
jgi:long-chain acyl-CoA synthetase